jgi:LysM domain
MNVMDVLTRQSGVRYNRVGALVSGDGGVANHPMSSSPTPFSSPEDQRERLIPFPSRSTSEAELATYGANARRRERRDSERAARRRPRRRHRTPWLQRNALSVAAVSVLVALLGLGFGLLQLLNRPDATPAPVASEVTDQASTASMLNMASTSLPPVPIAAEARREIQASVRVIEPTYTVEAGDTLARIAARYNTTAERIQALNNLPDPRTLRIGARLIIPAPL